MPYQDGSTVAYTDQALQERRGPPYPPHQRHHYAIYGLTLSSQLELPELLPIPACPDPDVEILAGPLPERLENAKVSNTRGQYADDQYQFELEGVARYRVERGRHLRVDRRQFTIDGPDTPEENIRHHLLDTALRALLHQRCWLPLQLSAVSTPSGVWGFTGRSGAGKSTLAAWLNYRYGWPLVTDDMAVVKPDEALPILYPGPPGLKVSGDTLAALGIDQGDLGRNWPMPDTHHLLQDARFETGVQPLRALVILDIAADDTSASLERLEGTQATEAIMASLDRPEWDQAFSGSAHRLHDATDLARRIEVYRYRRPWSLSRMEQSLAPLVARLHEGARHEA